MSDKTHKSKFLTAIIHAGNHASTGNRSQMNKYISEAKRHHKNHVTDHETKHGRESATAEHERFNSYYDHIKEIFNGKDVKKSELAKGIGTQPELTPNAALAPKPSHNPNVTTDSVGKNSKYTYKPFHDLTPDQQVSAKKKFGGVDMESHHYPLNEDGTIAHTSRWKDPTPRASNEGSPAQSKKPHLVDASNAPEANNPKLIPHDGGTLPHHAAGSHITVKNPAHDFHGRVGKVLEPHPDHPGKLHVEFLSRRGQAGGTKRVMVEPQHAHPYKYRSEPPSTLKSEANVVSLAKIALEKLKKGG